MERDFSTLSTSCDVWPLIFWSNGVAMSAANTITTSARLPNEVITQAGGLGIAGNFAGLSSRSGIRISAYKESITAHVISPAQKISETKCAPAAMRPMPIKSAKRIVPMIILHAIFLFLRQKRSAKTPS